MKKKISLVDICVIILGAFLFVVLTDARIPIYNNVALQVRAGLITFLAAAFGPIVGGAIGIIGHAAGDIIFYKEIFWGWVIADGCFGIIVGVFAKSFKVFENEFGKKELISFNVVQLIANLVSWILIAPALDIVLGNEGPAVAFEQGAVAAVTNIVTVLILGTFLCYGYSLTIKRK